MSAQHLLSRGRGARGRLRRLARTRPDLGARPEPAGRQPAAAQPPAESAVRRHHADRIAGLVEVRRAADQVPAAGAAVGCRRWSATPTASPPTMPRDSSRARAIRTFRRTAANPGAEYGRSSFDVRHRTSISLTYDLPLRRQRLARRLAAAGSADLPERPAVHGRGASRHRRQQHRPLESRASATTTGRTSPAIPALSESARAETRWFDSGAFSMPAFGTFGNSGRNTLEGPGYRTSTWRCSS